jgi:hypothetical protein
LGRAFRAGLVLGLSVWLGLCPLLPANKLMEDPLIPELLSVNFFPSPLLKWRVTIWLFMILSFAFITVPIVGLMIGIIVLVCSDAVEARTRPNQGTHRSARTAVTAVLTLGLTGGLVGILVSGPLFKPGVYIMAKGLILGLFYGLSCGLIVGMVAGGLFSLRHFALRLALWASGLAPLAYVRFLDHAVDRLFLRKVGGGYIFIHRVIMEYFASLAEPDGGGTL